MTKYTYLPTYLANLLKVFSKELASRERCQSIKSSEPCSQIIGSQGLNSGSILHVAFENHNRNPPKITFIYCRQNHPSNCCRVVTDVFARKKILQDKCKCYSCLKTGHSVKIALRNIVVLLVKGNIKYLFVNLKLIRLRKITQVKTRYLKMKLKIQKIITSQVAVRVQQLF